MAMSIRDPRANELATEFAAIRKINKTQAVITALELALAQEKNVVPLVDRVMGIADSFLAETSPIERTATKADFDDMWGN